VRRGGGTDTGFLQAVYQDILGRAPDPAGLAFWAQILANGDFEEAQEEPASPARRQEVAASILQSLESSQDQVQTWYSQYLHRAADPIGLGGLSNALRQGLSDESAIAIIIGSDEYFAQASGLRG
jgi:hypothetical protein